MTAFIVYMLSLGLATSLHCVSMCGPLVLTYAVRAEEGGAWYRRVTPNLAYQGAKIVSYMLVGLLLGAVGSFFDLDAIRPYVLFLAGAFMIALGLGMTGRVKWAQKLTPRAPKWLMRALARARRKSVADADAGTSTLATPISLGLMTGLLPCGPLMAAEVAAAASGTALTGALGMMAFGIGTAPLMVAFGTAGSLIPGVWKQRMMTILAMGVILFGLVFIDRGLMLTGSPVNFTAAKASAVALVTGDDGGTGSTFTEAADGVVEVPLVIEGSKYVPSTVRVPADARVRIVVDRREAEDCSDQVTFPQLDRAYNLTPNAVTKLAFPPTRSGTYTMTSACGMMHGQLVAEGSTAPRGRPLGVVWIGLVAVGMVAVGWLGYRAKRGKSQAF